MALQFILGSSGSGKSFYAYNEIIDASLNNPDNNYILLVPEQYSMALQRKLVSMHPCKGSMNIDVIGFNRLCYRVFDELNVKPANVLEDFGKSMLIRQVAGEHRDELSVYGDCLDKLGFIDEVKSLMSELYQYDIDKEKLSKAIDELSDTEDVLLKRKLTDMKIIFEAFQNKIGDEYIVAEQLTDLLADYIGSSKLIKKSNIVMDGFTGFTPIQMKVLSKLMENAIDVTIIITIDKLSYEKGKIQPHELFYLSMETIDKIKKLAKKYNVEIKKNIFISENKVRWNAAEGGLIHLEKNIFRFPYKKYDKAPKDIHLNVYDNPRKELEGVAYRIRELVTAGRYRYRDIALVCGNLEQQSAYVKQLFPIYEIPYFLDENEPLKNNPYVDSIGHLLRIVDENFSYDSVFAFLKCGVVDIDSDDVELIENYVLEKGIRGYSWWNKEWKSDTEETRAYIMGLLSPFYQSVKGKNNKSSVFAHALKNMFEELSFDKGLEEYPHVYESIIKLLDKIMLIMPEDTFDAKEFRDILEVGMKDISIGRIPGCIDQIIVGDITRTRLDDIKVLFILGMNDGIIPASGVSPQIISDMDKERLLGFDLELAPTERLNSYIQQFYLYLNMTKPSEELYVSYTAMNDGNEQMRPSYIVGRITNIFPKLCLSYDNNKVRVSTLEGSVSSLIVGMKKLMEGDTTEIDNILSLYRLYIEKDNSGLLDRLKRAMLYCNIPERLSEDVASLLKLRLDVLSVSRLEQYAKCAYSYYLRYTIGIDERKIKLIDKRDVGNILHSAMESLYRHVHDNLENDWEKLEDKQRDELISNFVYKEFDESFDNEGEYRPVRRMLARLGRRTAEVMSQVTKKDGYIPEYFEYSFKEGLKLDRNGQKITIRGVVDRGDVKCIDNKLYLRIIDYKTGDYDFEVRKLYEGTQLQLALYTGIMEELVKREYSPDSGIEQVIPDGMYYYRMSDPMVKVDDVSKIESERNKKLKLKGLDSRNSDKLRLAVDYASVKVKEMAGSILDGDISINPIFEDRNPQCSVCPYKAVCRFDRKYGGNSYHYPTYAKNVKGSEEAFEQIKKELGGDSDAVDQGTADNN